MAHETMEVMQGQMPQNFILDARYRVLTGAMQDPNSILEVPLREPCSKLIKEGQNKETS